MERKILHLWTHVERIARSEVLGADMVVNGTGDGVMIACSGFQFPIKHSTLLLVARGLIRHMRSTPDPIEVRIALHVGDFGKVQPIAMIPIQGVGSGINTCARFVPMGDPGDIVVSENFLRDWSQTSGMGAYEGFFPRHPRPPIEVIVKHGTRIRFRVHRPKRSRKTIPLRVADFAKARGDLLSSLEAVGVAFRLCIANAHPTVRFGADSVRVSIFEPGQQEFSRVLLATEFSYCERYHCHHNDLVAYRCHPSDWSGVVGKSFVTGRRQEIHDLPDWCADEEGYARRLKSLHLARSELAKLDRRARTFLAFPFGLHSDQPEGIVCIDTLESLGQVTRAEMLAIAEALKAEFADTISVCWRTRGAI